MAPENVAGLCGEGRKAVRRRVEALMSAKSPKNALARKRERDGKKSENKRSAWHYGTLRSRARGITP